MSLGDKEIIAGRLGKKICVGIGLLSVPALIVISLAHKRDQTDRISLDGGIHSESTRNPASDGDCKTGMIYYKDNRTSMSTDGTDGWKNCPENCASPEEFPGFSWSDPTTFSRDLDTVGMCSSFASADFIGQQLKAINKWPQDQEYNKGVSALDLEIQAFAEENNDPQKNNINNFLGPNAAEEGKWDNSIYKQPYDFYRIAKAKGVCPESAMPSEFRGNGRIGDLRSVYEALQKHLRESKKATEANVSLPGICPECGVMVPGLSEDQWRQIDVVLKSVSNLNQSDFLVLKKIDDIACEGKRISLPTASQIEPMNFAQMEKYLSITGSVAILDIHAAPLDPDHIKPTPANNSPNYDRHNAVVYGTVTKLVNNKVVCFYKLKNSWGPSACTNEWAGKNSTNVQCVPQDGSYLVSTDQLKTMLIGASR